MSSLTAASAASPMTYSSRRAAAATVALVLGGFGIGTAEFVTMGLLPQIASGLDISIPQAGHAVSAYAAGVVVGAPGLAMIGASRPRKGLLAVLAAVIAVGNIAAALAPSYGLLVVARFVAGLPHGAFFGVAALVAMSMAPPGRGGRAVGRVMLGIPVANVAGVPLATWLGQNWGWRTAYWLVGAVGLLTFAAILAVVPRMVPNADASFRTELAAFRSVQVWLTLAVGAVGFGGVFAMYSYIAPTVTELTGRPESVVPVFLLVFGVGGVVGTWLAGRLADWSVLRTLTIGIAATAVLLAVFTVAIHDVVAGIIVLFLISVATSLFVLSLQLRLMRVAGAAETLGAASTHSALNFANGLGAWLGGVVIDRGLGFLAPSWVGVGLSIGGLAFLWLSLRVHVRDRWV